MRSGFNVIVLGEYIPGRHGESKSLSSTVLVYLNYVCLRIECNKDCCITCMCILVIIVTSDGP